jgi:signal transduction histidine kinase/CheY-like chemotaxis protein
VIAAHGLASSNAAHPTTPPRGRGSRLVLAGTQRPSRIILGFAFLALAPLLVFAYFGVDIASRTVTSAVQDRLSGMSSIGAAYVERQVLGLADLVGADARGPTLTAGAADGNYANYRSKDIIPVLVDLQKAVPGIQFASLIDPAGGQRFIIPDNPALIGGDYRYRDWYQGVMRTDYTYVSEAYATVLPGQPLVIGIASPVLNPKGEVLAILLAGYRLDAIQSLVSNLASSQGLDLTVTDQRGTILAAPGTPPTSLVSAKSLPGVAGALEGRGSLQQVTKGGISYMSAYSPITALGWTISAAIPLSVALAGVRELQEFIFTLTAILATISIAGLVFLGLLLRQRRLSEHALAVSEATALEARIRADGILALNHAKDELMSTVSHELRTPLASLVGFTELLVTRDYPEAQQKAYLTTMLEEGRRLTSLINDFLDLQRMESGKKPIAATPLDLRILIERAVAAAGPTESTPITTDLPADLPLVRAEGNSVIQVIANLLSNARKYSPAGGAIHVKAMAVDDWVKVSIQDSGLGIPRNVIHRLFETFYRVDNTDRREIAGTGLGLAISKRIIQSLGGTIAIESEGLGTGSCVTFTLPVARAEAKVGDVLLVEDDAGFAHLLEAELATQGLSAVWAADAETAEKLMEQMAARAVVLDLVLPGKQGPEFLEWLRKGRGTGVPIVVVTVKTLSPAEIDAFQVAGVKAVLAKHDNGAKRAADLIAEALAVRAK